MNTNIARTAAGLKSLVEAEHPNIGGIAVRKRGKQVYEGCFGDFGFSDAFHIYSVTKSVTSALVGIAMDEGLLKSVDEPVLSFFPDFNCDPSHSEAKDVTIENLLTMTAPYSYDVEPFEDFFASDHLVDDALGFLGGKPIGVFNYSAIGGTHILAGIMKKATGKSLFEYGNEKLFKPLGMNVPGNIAIPGREEHFAIMGDPSTKGWVVDPQGLNYASWGLFLTAADMAKLGQLYCDGGLWNGKRILSESWIKASTTKHSKSTDWGLDYGYLWWLPDSDSFAAMGDGGNIIYVNRKKQLSVSIAATFVEEPTDRIGLIKGYIEPLFG